MDNVVLYITIIKMVNLIIGALLTNNIDIDLPEPALVYYCYAKNILVMCLGGTYSQMVISGRTHDYSPVRTILLSYYAIFGVMGTLPIIFVFPNNNMNYILEKGETKYFAFYMINYILAMKDLAFIAIYFLYLVSRSHITSNQVRVVPLPMVQAPPVAAMPERVFKEEGECTICYVGEPDKVLGCGHTMCAGCVSKMTSVSQCPFCRRQLSVVVSTNG